MPKTVAAFGIALAACASLIAEQTSSPSGFDPAYSLESRAAIGAHHLCSGLWVVGQVHKRTAEQILAEDIAPFKDFSWDKRFEYRVDAGDHTVTVSGPGIPARTARFNGDQGCAILPRGETGLHRSEERRVGKECRSRWWAEQLKRKERE